MALLAALLLPLESGAAQSASTMQPDVYRLVQAAGAVSETWPDQPPPPVPEVAIVARHGKSVVPLLMNLLSDTPESGRDRQAWRVQQQVTLTLALIYGGSSACGRVYCDDDSAERIAGVKDGWRRVIAADRELRALPASELLVRFKQEKLFFRQFETGRALAAANDRTIIAGLADWLTHDDRHLRGNVAFVLARLGDPRGFETIAAILADSSPRSAGQGNPTAKWSMSGQIRADRYYAAHLLGDSKDPRGAALLIPLLDDEDVRHIAPWSLAEIGDRRAVEPLIRQLKRDDPSMRVLVIHALERLHAREALPALRELRLDHRRSTLGDPVSVAEAARHAVAVISAVPNRPLSTPRMSWSARAGTSRTTRPRRR